jgi:hypothetical protein
MSVCNTNLANTDKTHAWSEPGMAHFAGTGPKGKTCGGCKFWTHRTANFYGCDKYKELMRGKAGKPIRGSLPACKYFEQKPQPPEPKPWVSPYRP